METRVLAERYVWLDGCLLERDNDQDEKDGAKTRRPVVLVCVPLSPFLSLPALFPAIFWARQAEVDSASFMERTGMVFLGIVMTVFFWTWILRR